MATTKPKTAKSVTSTSPVADAMLNNGFASFKDGAFQQAGADSTLESFARYCIEKAKDFPKEIPSEVKDEIYEGYRMRFDQLFPKKTYAVIDGHYVRATPEHMETANVEKIEIGVAYAYSYTSQEFGKLAQTRPALHGLVKMIREKCATYCSNRMSDLKRRANTILNEGKERTRTANKNFAEFVDEWFKEIAPTRLKGAKNRGDSTAIDKKFNEAKVAFMVKWNA